MAYLIFIQKLQVIYGIVYGKKRNERPITHWTFTARTEYYTMN